eukprot:GHVU01053214.1.p1 GENE.GHVU01053214.1~~GHVU01053214.1.p1  ORF type:complete len:113 (-),score=8.28 GHVU01053214.1:572-910(-)
MSDCDSSSPEAHSLHTRTHIHTPTHTHPYTSTNTPTHTRTQTYTHTHTHTRNARNGWTTSSIGCCAGLLSRAAEASGSRAAAAVISRTRGNEGKPWSSSFNRSPGEGGRARG